MLLKKSLVIYIKIQGYEKKGLLMKDNFIIVIMKSYQKYILTKKATNRICGWYVWNNQS